MQPIHPMRTKHPVIQQLLGLSAEPKYSSRTSPTNTTYIANQLDHLPII